MTAALRRNENYRRMNGHLRWAPFPASTRPPGLDPRPPCRNHPFLTHRQALETSGRIGPYRAPACARASPRACFWLGGVNLTGNNISDQSQAEAEPHKVSPWKGEIGPKS